LKRSVSVLGTGDEILKLVPSSVFAPIKRGTALNFPSRISWLGYPVRKSPSMIGFQTWLGAAAKRVEELRFLRHASWFEVVQQPTVRVRFSTGGE
jgi:hypothetical protein